MTQTREEGEDWRSELSRKAEVGTFASDIARARERGRGRSAEFPDQIPSAGWIDIGWRVLRSVPKNRLTTTAGGVAFFALMAIFPAIATIVSLYGLFADSHAIVNHVALLAGIVPAGVLDLLTQQILLVAGSSNNTLSVAFLIGFLLAFWSANSGVSALFDALNVVYGEKEKRSLLQFYGRTLAVTLGSVVFGVVALIGVVILPLAFKLVGLSAHTEKFLTILRWPLLLLVVTVGLSVVYRVGPSRNNAKWRWVTWGSVLAAVFWVASSMVFSWYVSAFDSYNRIYGSLGAAVGFMTWIWLSIVIVLLGAELNAEMEHQTARDTTEGYPKPLGARGANMADHVGESVSEK
jgi:membrane protein